MSVQIDALKAQVATTVQLETQAIALLQSGGGGLPASDLAQVVVLTGQLKTSSDALAAVINGGTGGGTSTEAADIAAIATAAQQAGSVSTDPVQVQGFVTQMQASAAKLSGAFTRNTPPLSAAVTAQEVAALANITSLLSQLSGATTDPNQVVSLASQIQVVAATLAALIANNPRTPTLRSR